MASFTCNGGYSLSGSATSTCQDDGNWDHTSSQCGKITKCSQIDFVLDIDLDMCRLYKNSSAANSALSNQQLHLSYY